MKIVMMATGGVGGYYGARLAAAGEDVRFVAGGAHLAALRANGLKLISANGNLHLRSVDATDDPATIGVADVVIFAVKQYDTEAAAKLIVPVIGDETAVISIQNGMGPQEKLKKIVGRKHVMGGTTYITGAKVMSRAARPILPARKSCRPALTRTLARSHVLCSAISTERSASWVSVS